MAGRCEVVVIGGGPAGSVAALCIAQTGRSVILLEKRPFPRETLCGEFLSGEAVASIRGLGLDNAFRALRANPLTTFRLLPGTAGPVRSPLGFTGYGIRRGAFDAMLLDAAAAHGVEILQPAEAIAVERDRGGFLVRYTMGRQRHVIRGAWVVGAYGKNSPLDRLLLRPCAGARTGFTGIKFHLPAELLEHLPHQEITIALGRDMYCGISHVDHGTATLCCLERRAGDAPARARVSELARRNPEFARMVTPAALRFLRQAPIYGSGNIFFGARAPVAEGVLMIGDAAGVIAPLAGDGIGIALEQARLLGRLFAEWQPGTGGGRPMAERYQRESSRLFERRRRVALLCQRLALTEMLRPAVTPLLSAAPGLLRAAIRATRGRIS